VYNSNTVKDIPSRLKSIFVLTLAFPIIAYGELTKHKKDFIKEINQDNNLSTKQKHRLIRRLSSNSRVLSFVVLSSIRRFKPLLDTHVKFLNDYKKKNNQELNLSLRVKFELKKSDINIDYYKDNISGLFA